MKRNLFEYRLIDKTSPILGAYGSRGGVRPSQEDTYGGNTERGESSRPAEAREFRAGRDKRKKGGRVFSLENRVDLRLSMENGKSVLMYVYVYILSYICVCMRVPVVCRCTKSGKSIFRKTVNCEM